MFDVYQKTDVNTWRLLCTLTQPTDAGELTCAVQQAWPGLEFRVEARTGERILESRAVAGLPPMNAISVTPNPIRPGQVLSIAVQQVARQEGQKIAIFDVTGRLVVELPL